MRKTEEVEVDIPDFRREPIENSPTQIVNNNRLRLFEYLAENSRVVNVFAMSNYYIVEAQTGTLGMSGEDRFKNRETNITVLTNQLEQIDTIVFKNPNFVVSNLKAVKGNKLYLVYRDRSDEFKYKLETWEIVR